MTFVEAVIAQRVYPLDAPATFPSGLLEDPVVDQVARLIERIREGDAEVALAARELANDPALLAAFYQNLDLLPADGGPTVDAIALLALAALQWLADTPPDALPDS